MSSSSKSYVHSVDPILVLILRFPFDYTASKEDLIPPVPVLTRYSKEAGIKAFVKKELFDSRVPEPEETRPREINVLTTPTLCVQLNTLYVSSGYLELYLDYFLFFNG